ncbi:MAG: NTP transferase domain-containing protein [Sphingomicrobium sp.]
MLAGSRPGGDPLAAQFGAAIKALILVAGEPMVRRPVRALLASENIGQVLVMTQDPDALAGVPAADPRLAICRSGDTIAATLLALCDDPDVSWPILVTTADHALLDAATVDEFCAAAVGSDIAIGVVERNALMRRLPGTRRTWLKFRGGAFTGANLFALRSPQVRDAIALWQSVEQDRKKAWRIISLLGPAMLMLAGLRLVSLDEVMMRLGDRLGLRLKAIALTNPLAGVDVDKPEDHALAEAILGGRA